MSADARKKQVGVVLGVVGMLASTAYRFILESDMAYEIDYIQVGDGERSGDAIALRFGNLHGQRNEQTVVVIDGGDLAAGEKLVGHINDLYKTNHVDFVVSTHPDGDHASGLREVLGNMSVDTLLMHKPWEHASDIKDAFRDGRWTERGLGEAFEKSIRYASELDEIARENNINVVEPFAGIGTQNLSIQVLGPSKDYYQELVPNYRTTPQAKGASMIGSFAQTAKKAVEWIEDNWGLDLLNDDEDKTSAENNSSTVVLFNVDGHRLLFTGDAGKTALLRAADYADGIGVSLVDLEFLDVPHHGSKRNISSKVLKRINGQTAFISASTGSEKHPSKKVINGLKKHNSRVFVTRGDTLCRNYNGPDRGWGAAIEEPFYSQVEE